MEVLEHIGETGQREGQGWCPLTQFYSCSSPSKRGMVELVQPPHYGWQEVKRGRSSNQYPQIWLPLTPQTPTAGEPSSSSGDVSNNTAVPAAIMNKQAAGQVYEPSSHPATCHIPPPPWGCPKTKETWIQQQHLPTHTGKREQKLVL